MNPDGYILVDSSSPDGLSHLVTGVLSDGNAQVHGQPFTVTWEDGSITFLQAVTYTKE